MKYALSGIMLLLYLMPLASFCQESTAVTTTDKIINLPSKFFSRIQRKTADLDKQCNLHRHYTLNSPNIRTQEFMDFRAEG